VSKRVSMILMMVLGLVAAGASRAAAQSGGEGALCGSRGLLPCGPGLRCVGGQPEVDVPGTCQRPGQGQGPRQSYFLIVGPDLRRCASPYCGGYFVSLANQKTMQCPNGSSSATCYVSSVDLSAMGLDPGEASAVLAGNTVVLGRIVPRRGFPGLGDLMGRAAWRAPTDARPTEPLYRAEFNGTVCITYPCPSIDARKLNTDQLETVSAVDLTGAPGTDKDREQGQNAIFARGQGLIASGHIVVVVDAGPAGDAEVLKAEQFYLPVTSQGTSP
jgi:hypothetical protein